MNSMETTRELERQTASIATDLYNLYFDEEAYDAEHSDDGDNFDEDGYNENGEDRVSRHFQDVLDIEYHVGSDNEVRSVELLVGFGGPNLYIDTKYMQVKGYWASSTATAMIDNRVCAEIEEYFEQLRGC